MIVYKEILGLFPEDMGLTVPAGSVPEELRIRLGRVPTAVWDGQERRIGSSPVTEDQLRRILERATGASLHTHREELRRGYLSFSGIRIGVCGEGVLSESELTGFRRISSLNIRIPSEHRGMCRPILERMARSGDGSVLLLAAPGGGKTTALRELVRALSEKGKTVAVLDERGELLCGGGFDLGARTDVLSFVPKAEGAMTVLRTMTPEYIAMDEITAPEDIAAMEQVAGCGVHILATAHARSREELGARPLYRRLLGLELFSYLVILHRRGRECAVQVETLSCSA